jgi:hypothetical protein
MGRFEIFTNAIDAFAFLMVTVDLYGKERLEALHQRLKGVKLPRFDPFAFRKTVILYNEPSRNSGWREVAIVAGAFGMAMICLFSILGLIFYVADGLLWGWPNATNAIWDGVKLSLVLLGAAYLVVVVVYMIWLTRIIIVRGFLYLTQIFRIEGMMVVTGATLFILARVATIGFIAFDGAPSLPATSQSYYFQQYIAASIVSDQNALAHSR